MPVKKPKTVSQLKKEADRVFSIYIRRSAARDGMASCVTCDVLKPWQELQNGHYEKRSINALRFDERNCHPQCVGCNVFKKGNYPRYAQFMVKKYGQSILDTLEQEAKSMKQWKAHELQELIDTYKTKLEQLND